MFWDWWQSLFTDMPAYAFFNFKFLPKYGYAVMQGVEYTLILSVVSVLLAVLPALLLATMRLSRCTPVRWLAGAYSAVFRSTPMLVQLIIIYYGVFNAILVPKFMILGFIDSTRFIPGVVALAIGALRFVSHHGLLLLRSKVQGPRRPGVSLTRLYQDACQTSFRAPEGRVEAVLPLFGQCTMVRGPQIGTRRATTLS